MDVHTYIALAAVRTDAFPRATYPPPVFTHSALSFFFHFGLHPGEDVGRRRVAHFTPTRSFLGQQERITYRANIQTFLKQTRLLYAIRGIVDVLCCGSPPTSSSPSFFLWVVFASFRSFPASPFKKIAAFASIWLISRSLKFASVALRMQASERARPYNTFLRSQFRVRFAFSVTDPGAAAGIEILLGLFWPMLILGNELWDDVAPTEGAILLMLPA